MNHLANEDNIFSNTSKKLKKKIANTSYWDNTHPTATAIQQQKEIDDECECEGGDGKKPNGYALLKKVYGGSKHSQLIPTRVQNQLNKRYNKVVDNYSDIVRHLEEHQREGVGDPQDIKQSKYLRKEIKRINKLHLTQANQVSGDDPLYKVSNPRKTQQLAFQLYGKDAIVYKSDKKEKKYMILDENTGKFIHFGQMKPPMEDYLKHQDEERRKRYIARASKIRGNWKKNIYSPNLLSLVLLWDAELSDIV